MADNLPAGLLGEISASITELPAAELGIGGLTCGLTCAYNADPFDPKLNSSIIENVRKIMK
ncbi:MAG: hypothetical protein NMNS01_18560 [Nitrosomonas sp.]|nr:MAG: hypothetical protein NMNS01_18560 [Nitrosomonas sp.]